MIPVALALLVNLNTLWNGFAIDDQQQIVNNTFIRSLRNLPQAFTSSVWTFGSSDVVFTAAPYYRPLFNVLFTINYALFGESAWGWHLVNLLIHAAVVLLCFLLLRRLSGQEWLAAAAASLFAVHPVHAESVAWISGVPDPLMALFLLPAFIFYLQYRATNNKNYLALTLALFLGGLLCKETALSFPLLIFLSELFYFDDTKKFKEKIPRGLGRTALFLIPAAIYFGLRYHAIGSFLFKGEARHSLGPAVKSVPFALAKYLGLMSLPFEYSYQHYTLPVKTITALGFLAPLVLVLGVVTAAIMTRNRWLRFAIIWFIVFLMPALAGLRQFDPEYLIQERYLYLSSIGFCLALAIGLEWLAMSGAIRWSGRQAASAFVGVIVLGLSVVTVLQNRVWRDSITVFRHCVLVDPGSAIAHSSLAHVYADAGRGREATDEANAALKLNSNSSDAYLMLSYVAFRSRKLNDAAAMLEKGLATIPIDGDTRKGVATMQLNLALLYQQQKNSAGADALFRQTIQTSPRALAWFRAGQFYLEQKRYADARSMFAEAYQLLPPRYAPIYMMLGEAYEGLGQPAQAKLHFQKFLDLAPNDSVDSQRVRQHLLSL